MNSLLLFPCLAAAHATRTNEQNVSARAQSAKTHCPPRTSRIRMETRQSLTRRAFQKSGLAPENSPLRNTEQQPDVSVAARHPETRITKVRHRLPDSNPSIKTQILLTVISTISSVNQNLSSS